MTHFEIRASYNRGVDVKCFRRLERSVAGMDVTKNMESGAYTMELLAKMRAS